MPEIRELPCQLTDIEKAVKSQELTAKLMDKATAEEEKKQVAAAATAKVKELSLEINKLVGQLHSGTEMREVRVSERRNEEDGYIEILREDTWETIARRLMTQEERQRKLNLIPFKKKAEGDPEVQATETGEESPFSE